MLFVTHQAVWPSVDTEMYIMADADSRLCNPQNALSKTNALVDLKREVNWAVRTKSIYQHKLLSIIEYGYVERNTLWPFHYQETLYITH